MPHRSINRAVLAVVFAMLALLAGPKVWAAGLGETCHIAKKCSSGLSCHPFIQKCYHEPRQFDEPCMAGFSCGPGLTCQAGTQRCVGPSKEGETCHLTRPCGEGLTCEAGRQKCVAPGKLGDSCHPTKPCGKDLTCMTGSQVCSHGGRPIPLPGDFPPPAAAKPAAQRLADCKSSADFKCYSEIKVDRTAGIASNCLYGWHVGKGHPASSTNPPDYSRLLNALDQCAWFHDRGAWQYNRNTRVCEHWTMCSNSMGLSRCMERFQPRTKEETEARACFMDNFRDAIKACVPALYQDWGAEFEKAPSGEQWLSAKSISELRGAMKQCPYDMKNTGFVVP